VARRVHRLAQRGHERIRDITAGEEGRAVARPRDDDVRAGDTAALVQRHLRLKLKQLKLIQQSREMTSFRATVLPSGAAGLPQSVTAR
jgi:hypothetical protein